MQEVARQEIQESRAKDGPSPYQATREELVKRQETLRSAMNTSKSELDTFVKCLAHGVEQEQHCRDKIAEYRTLLSEWHQKNVGMRCAIKDADAAIRQDEIEIDRLDAHISTNRVIEPTLSTDALATRLCIIPHVCTHANGHTRLLAILLDIYRSPHPFDQKFPPAPGNTAHVPVLKSEVTPRGLVIWNRLTAEWVSRMEDPRQVSAVQALHRPDHGDHKDGDTLIVWGWWLHRLWRLSKRKEMKDGLWRSVERALYEKSQLVSHDKLE